MKHIAGAVARRDRAGIVLGDGATCRRHIDLGFQFINVTTDIGLIMSGFARELAIARGG